VYKVSREIPTERCGPRGTSLTRKMQLKDKKNRGRLASNKSGICLSLCFILRYINKTILIYPFIRLFNYLFVLTSQYYKIQYYCMAWKCSLSLIHRRF